jgi:hypothetical protein
MAGSNNNQGGTPDGTNEKVRIFSAPAMPWCNFPLIRGCSQCNWPQGGAPGPIAISTREGISDSGERVPTSQQPTIEALCRLSALRLMGGRIVSHGYSRRRTNSKGTELIRPGWHAGRSNEKVRIVSACVIPRRLSVAALGATLSLPIRASRPPTERPHPTSSKSLRRRQGLWSGGKKLLENRCRYFFWNSSAAARVTSLCRLRTAIFGWA